MINKNKIPCEECGHLQKVHKKLAGYNGQLVCLIKGSDTTDYDCPCYNYTTDNLSYLERRYEEKEKKA